MANLNTITRPSGIKRPYRRVGRGQSSTRGKQSGRGGKGQTARAGNKRRPELRDIIKKIPKRRGYGKNRGRTVWAMKPRPVALSLKAIESAFDAGATVTPSSLLEKGMVKSRTKKAPAVKIVGESIAKKLSFSGVRVSLGAKAAIEKAGGSVQ